MSSSPSPLPGTPTSVSPAGMLAPSRGKADCQYPGCLTRAKYGPKDAPPTACQVHKRAGQYTINRHGEMLIATRDGDAFRTPAAATAPVSPAPSNGTAVTPDQSRGASVKGTEKPSSSGRKGAKVSTYSAERAKRANRPGLTSANGDGSPPSQSQNRPCLFPGCNSLPEYGLPGAARAVYCFSHKKGSMVRIVTGALDLQDDGDKPKTPTAVAASNKTVTKKSNSKRPSAAAASPGSKKKARAPTTKDESAAKKARHEAKSEANDGTSCDNPDNHTAKKGTENDRKETLGAGCGPNPIVGDSTAPAATETASPREPVSGSPPASRMGDATDMAPSAEILLVRQAREAAKKEAEAAGGGRRPRAPSRRALEASGRMTGTGAQWMTREKKAEEARVMAELREQRKQYRAAGLKFGHVLEAFVPAAVVAGATGGGGGSGGVGGGSGEVVAEAVMPQSDPGWHKIPPAVLSVPPLQPQTTDGSNAPSAPAAEMGEKQAAPTAAANSA